MATRRGFFGYLTIPFLAWSGKAFAVSPPPTPGTITINPRELWLREITYQWLKNARYYESRNGKLWSDASSIIRYDIVYLSDVLERDSKGLQNLLSIPWPEICMGGKSHIEIMARTLTMFEADGRLNLYLNPDNPNQILDNYASDLDVHRAYEMIFPIVKDLVL